MQSAISPNAFFFTKIVLLRKKCAHWANQAGLQKLNYNDRGEKAVNHQDVRKRCLCAAISTKKVSEEFATEKAFSKRGVGATQ